MQRIEIQLTSKHSARPFMADATFLADGNAKPVVIFNHGFKGFKDWGPFALIAEEFAQNGFVFIKMNFSHNGVTATNPFDFADLEAFARNNFSIELDDTGVLIDSLFDKSNGIPSEEVDLNRLYIIGHSRGGASAILKANEDARIKGLITWAAVSNLESWHSKQEVNAWKQVGRIYIHNSRTNQDMPMDYQLVENYLANKDRLEVPKAVQDMSIPMLSFHGTDDPTVPLQAVQDIAHWNPKARIEIIEGAGHTFGGTHPFDDHKLPSHLRHVVNTSIEFCKTLQ